MPGSINRRQFLGASAIAAGLSFDTRALKAQISTAGQTRSRPAAAPPPRGRIGKLEVSRLICGGNLFSGFAHSGDLLYVSGLLKHYFSEDKILETLQLCEESGINTAILRTDEHIIGALKRYRQERGGKIQWIAQTYPTVANPRDNIKIAIDNGAVGAFMMGANAETIVKSGKGDLLGELVAFIKQNGLAAGIGSHAMEIPILSEQENFAPDFYFKTHNNVGYQSQDPRDIAALMKTIHKPWIAFKVLGAGRIEPRDGFTRAFKNGADFINVGMYDFQVGQNVGLVREVVQQCEQRDRKWAA